MKGSTAILNISLRMLSPPFPRARLQSFLLGRGSCEPHAASLQLWYLVLFSGGGCATGVLVPLLRGETGECQPRTMCSPSATELAVGWGHACLQLGDTPAFLSPVCLLTAWAATFLIICRGSLLAASFISVPSSLPLALSCKQVRASYLPPSVPGLGRTHPLPPRLSIAQASVTS